MIVVTSTDDQCIPDMPLPNEVRQAIIKIGQEYLYSEFSLDFKNVVSCFDLSESEISTALLMALFTGCAIGANLEKLV